MILTQAQALTIVSLDSMKSELRIPISETAHDVLLAEQIHSAASFVMESTGLALADLPAVRPAIIAGVRSQYDGSRELGPLSATYAWAQPFRSYKV